MEDHFILYRGKEIRKKELIGMLQGQLDQIHDSSEVLEKKAWELLTLTSGAFGVITAFQISFTNLVKLQLFPLLITVVLVFYILFVREVIIIVSPREWPMVPGVDPEKQLSYETLLSKYIPIDDDKYLDKLIVDYVGKNDEDGTYLPGAVQIAQDINRLKSDSVNRAVVLAAIVVGSVILLTSFAAVIPISLGT